MRALLLLPLLIACLAAAEPELLAALRQARAGGPAVAPPEGVDLVRAAALRQELQSALVSAGDPVLGVKLAFMTAAARESWGLSEPAWGFLHASMRVEDGGTVAASAFHRCLVEAEIAFVLAAEVRELPADQAGLLALVATVHPALDLADLRYGPGKPSGAALIADSCAAHRYVLGAGRSPSGIDLDMADLILRIDGAEAGRAQGTAIHGSPWAALRWYLHDRIAAGETVPAGLVILSGAGIAPVPVALDAGPRRIAAEVTGLGSVQACIE